MYDNDAGKGMHLYRKFRGKLHYDQAIHDPICYHCHIPICHNLLHDPIGSTCHHLDTVDCIAWAVYQGARTRPMLEKNFAMTFDSVDSYIAWLNGSPIRGHKSNLSAVFLWYTFFLFDIILD